MRRTKLRPFLELSGKDFSIPDFEVLALHARPELAKVEIIDAWGRPLCYDNLERRANFSAKVFDGRSAIRPHWPESVTAAGLNDGFKGDCGITESATALHDPRHPSDSKGCSDLAKKPSPRSSGHFDIWARGYLFSDPCDDITSWRR